MRERVPVNKEETAEDRLLNFVEEQTNKFTKYIFSIKKICIQ